MDWDTLHDIDCEELRALADAGCYEEAIEHATSQCIDCVIDEMKTSSVELLFTDKPPDWIDIADPPPPPRPEPWRTTFIKPSRPTTEEEIEKYLMEFNGGDENLVYEITKLKKCSKTAARVTMRVIRRKQKALRFEKEQEALKLKRKEEAMGRRAEVEQRMEDRKRKRVEEKQKEQEALDGMWKEAGSGEDGEIEKADVTNGTDVNDTTEDQEVPEEKMKVFNKKPQMPWNPKIKEIVGVTQRSAKTFDDQKRVVAIYNSLMTTGTTRYAHNLTELKEFLKETEDERIRYTEAALELMNLEVDVLATMLPQAESYMKGNWKKRYKGEMIFNQNKPLFTMDEELELNVGGRTRAVIPQLVSRLSKNVVHPRIAVPDMTKRCVLPFALPKGFKKETKIDILNDPEIFRFCGQTTSRIAMDATTACHLLSGEWECHKKNFLIHVTVKDADIGGSLKRLVIFSKPLFFGVIPRATVQRQFVKQLARREFVSEVVMKKKASGIVASSSMEECSNSDTHDLLGDILGEDSLEKKPPTETGYQYGHFKIGELDVLIRSNPPPKLDKSAPANTQSKALGTLVGTGDVTIEPKLEYLPSGGAMRMGTEEYLWNKLKTIFKMSKAHVLLRTHYGGTDVLQFDYRSMQEDIRLIPEDYLSLITSRTMRMEKFLSDCQGLDVGDYVICKDGAEPITLSHLKKASNNPDAKRIDKESLRVGTRDAEEVQREYKLEDYFYGLSTDVVLQWQVMQTRAPGTFLAADSNIARNLPNMKVIEKFAKQKEEKMKAHKKRMEKEMKKKQNEEDRKFQDYLKNI